MSEYDNPYGMSEQEFDYRAMNPQDPMYMGDKHSGTYNANDPYNPNGSYNVNGEIRRTKKNTGQSRGKAQRQCSEDDTQVIKDTSEWLFLVICFIVIGLVIWGGLWLLMMIGNP